ncbi:MAG: c-type cytochrome [bacterium]
MNPANIAVSTVTSVDQKTASEQGASLFQQTQFKRESTQGEEQALGCIVCHRLDHSSSESSPESLPVAPNLVGVGTRAKLVSLTMNAEDYLYESILNPDAHIVMGYEPNIMPNNYAQVLSKDEIHALVLYLLQL